MSDSNRMEDADHGADSAHSETSSTPQTRGIEAPLPSFSSHLFSQAARVISSVVRPMNIHSLLNREEPDEVVDGSDHDGDGASATPTGACATSPFASIAPHAAQVAEHDSHDEVVGLLMGLAGAAASPSPPRARSMEPTQAITGTRSGGGVPLMMGSMRSVENKTQHESQGGDVNSEPTSMMQDDGDGETTAAIATIATTVTDAVDEGGNALTVVADVAVEEPRRGARKAPSAKKPTAKAKPKPKPKAKAKTTKAKVVAAAAAEAQATDNAMHDGEASSGDGVGAVEAHAETPTPTQTHQTQTHAETDVQMEVETPRAAATGRNTREKRRTPPPPAPVRAAPAKRAKPTRAKSPKAQPPSSPVPSVETTTTSARPKRTATTVVSYVDVDGDDEDHDEDEVQVENNDDMDDDDDDDGGGGVNVQMVVAGSKVARTAAAAVARALAAPSAVHASNKKTKKRKAMSQRQFDELMNDDREPSGALLDLDAILPVAAVRRDTHAAAAAGRDVGMQHQQRPCEFCNKNHSAFAMFYCHSCRRMYHGKCLIDAFRPELRENMTIEDQMENLQLYRPPGRSALLRCSSCQAAFIDLFKNAELHRDCTCATCTTATHKCADYRRVMLKRIIDEHNLEFALKKGKGGGAKKASAKTPAATAPAAAPVAAATAPTPVRGRNAKTKATAAVVKMEEPVVAVETKAPPSRSARSRGSRRTRDAEQPDDPEDPPVAVVKTEGQDVKLQQDEGQAVAAEVAVVSGRTTRRARGRFAPAPVPVQSTPIVEAAQVVVKGDPEVVMKSSLNGNSELKTEQMEVDSHGYQKQKQEVATGDLMNDGDVTMEEDLPVDQKENQNQSQSQNQDDDEQDTTLSAKTLEQLIQISKDDVNETWSFRIACSSSGSAKESGTYKEATLFWHPNTQKRIQCYCCDKEDASLRWFVDHTDATLLTPPQDDPYLYLFVPQKNGELVPLESTLSIVRAAFRDAKHRRRSDPALDSTASHELTRDQQDALKTLRTVLFTPKQPKETKRRHSGGGNTTTTTSTVAPAFTCEVLCASERWLKPVTGNETLYRNVVAHVSQDVWIKGTFEVQENPKNALRCKIHCACCDKNLSPSQFRDHVLKPLQLLQDQQLQQDEAVRQKEQQQHYRPLHPSNTTMAMADMNMETTAAATTRVVHVAMAVRLRDPSSALKLDTFLSALEKLGSQTEINKAIAAMVQVDTLPPRK